MKKARIPAILLSLAVGACALTGEEILEKMDRNRDHKTITATATMTIHIGDETRTKTMKIMGITKGGKSIVEFTNPEDEGTKYLMLDDNLWIYFPEEEDVVRISGHMLKEGMMGSDVSYEDALESDKLSKKYDITVAGKESIGENTCYVIDLRAKVKDVPYYHRKMWVDTRSFVAWKEEMFAKSGKLLKVGRVLETSRIDGRTVAVKSEMANKLRKNSRTIFEMTDLVFDRPLDEKLFTMRNLRR